ncbi:MAG: LysM peptidoglycan-binding domain-containing protein [Pseudomonadota bacterium]
MTRNAGIAAVAGLLFALVLVGLGLTMILRDPAVRSQLTGAFGGADSDVATGVGPSVDPPPNREAPTTVPEPVEEATVVGAAEEVAPEPVDAAAEVDVQAPETPVDMPTAPDFDVVRIDGAGAAVVAGRAAPEEDVTLRLDGQEVATVRADRDGNFVSFFDVQPSEAPRVLSLEAEDAGGAVRAAPGSIIVAPRRREAPEVETAAIDDRSTPDVTVEEADPPELAGESGEGVEAAPAPPRLLRTGPDGLRVIADDDTPPQVRTGLDIDAISYDAQGEVQLAGRAGQGADLRIYLDNEPVREVQADLSGAWASQLPDVPPGVYTLRIDSIGSDGGVERRVETPFQRTAPDLAAALTAGAEAVTVQPGFTLWAISEGHFGEGVQYVQIFEANREIIRDPDLIYPGQVFALPDPG